LLTGGSRNRKARIERAPRTVLVTSLNQANLEDLHMRSAKDLAGAVEIVLADLAEAGIRRPAYYLMPDAMYVVPFLRE